jgi:hypothetical protein
MEFVDKIKDALSGREAEAEAAIDKAGDFIDEKTGGQYAGQVDQAQSFLKDQIGQPNSGPQG